MKLILESKIENEYGASRVFTNVQTNADRIRSMSDEELAELFWIRADCNLCPNRKRYCSDDCKGAWLKWLHEEVKDD